MVARGECQDFKRVSFESSPIRGNNFWQSFFRIALLSSSMALRRDATILNWTRIEHRSLRIPTLTSPIRGTTYGLHRFEETITAMVFPAIYHQTVYIYHQRIQV